MGEGGGEGRGEEEEEEEEEDNGHLGVEKIYFPVTESRRAPSRATGRRRRRRRTTGGEERGHGFNWRYVVGNPDILICGNCREMFTELGELLEHKRNYCKLRFTCKCHTFNGAAPSMYSK